MAPIAQMKRQKARIRTRRALTPRVQGGLGSSSCLSASSVPSADTTAVSGLILLLRLLPDPTPTFVQPLRPGTSRVRRWKEPSLTRPPIEGGYGTFRPTSKADLVLGEKMDEGSMHSPRSDLVLLSVPRQTFIQAVGGIGGGVVGSRARRRQRANTRRFRKCMPPRISITRPTLALTASTAS